MVDHALNMLQSMGPPSAIAASPYPSAAPAFVTGSPASQEDMGGCS